jgi:hypothetical protein
MVRAPDSTTSFPGLQLCAAERDLSAGRFADSHVTEKYTPVQRSQHLTQADPRVFGQSYVANCSSVDGQAAFLGEALDHRHVDYFQSLEKFRESGLPCELPAHLEDRLRSDPHLCELESEIQAFKRQEVSGSSLKEAKDRLVSYRKTLKHATLRQY